MKWNSSLHPRVPSGTRTGGRFVNVTVKHVKPNTPLVIYVNGQKYDPNQPREPRGTPGGGRWAGGGNVGNINVGMIPKRRTWEQEKEIEHMKAEVATWEDEHRRWGGNRALTYPGEIIYMRDNGELVGLANLADEPVDKEGAWGGIYEAHYLGTKRPGYGNRMVDRIKQAIKARGGRGYYAFFNDDALAFHLHSGMKLGGPENNRDSQFVYWLTEWENE